MLQSASGVNRAAQRDKAKETDVRFRTLFCARRLLTGLAVLTLAVLSIATSVAAELPDTLERIKASVVAIGTYQRTRSPPFLFRGTGFVVGDGTLVATNAHVLPETLKAESGEGLIIVAYPGRPDAQLRQVTVQASDKTHDLSLLRLSGTALPALALHDAPPVREGQVFGFTGFPIGNALGLVPVTHRGIISAVTPIVLPTANAQQLNDKVIQRIRSGSFLVFQLDATAYPGNSGSPLYDVNTGRVVGIVNMVLVKSTREAALTQPSGISFAIPVQFLRQLLEEAN